MAIDTPAKVGEPVLRWSGRADSIAGIETELMRIWASQDLTPASDDAPGRRVAARTSVMNLVVVARMPEVAEHCAAAIQALTGRHPSRTVIIGSADPDGPSWLDARVEAVCVLPREDAPETCAEMIRVTRRRRGGPPPRRHRDAAHPPRPAGHRLVARRAAVRDEARARPAGRCGPPGRRRLQLERGRPRPAHRDGVAPGGHVDRRQRLRAHPPVALARGHRLDLRRPRLPPLPALAAPDRGHVRHPRRDLRAAARRTWSSRSTTSAGSPPGWACRSSSR